jgi:hypothetical protein
MQVVEDLQMIMEEFLEDLAVEVLELQQMVLMEQQILVVVVVLDIKVLLLEATAVAV